jgi:hypothetical protein
VGPGGGGNGAAVAPPSLSLPPQPASAVSKPAPVAKNSLRREGAMHRVY